MFSPLIIIGGILAYFIGSIPTAVWFGRIVHRIDIRDHGSGNPGATNTFRVLGKRAGTIVMLVDIAKGLLATFLATILLRMGVIPEDKLIITKLVYGMIAVIGHIFPVFLRFRGGKGVATLLGMMIGIEPVVALFSALIFLVVLLTTKYVSLSSMLGALSFPLMLVFIKKFQSGEPILVAFGFFLALVVIWSHHKNIKRLLQGDENKTHLIKKKERG